MGGITTTDAGSEDMKYVGDRYERLDWVVSRLLPEHQPGQWKPDRPIDLLPALRLHYPGCVEDGLLRVELVYEISAERISPSHFQVVRYGAGVEPLHIHCAPIYPITEDDDDGYDYSDARDAFPHEIIACVFDPLRLQRVQDTLHIFKAGFVSFAEVAGQSYRRAAQEECWAEMDYAEKRTTAHIEFLASWVRKASSHIADQIDLQAMAISSLKESDVWQMMVNEGTQLRDIGLSLFQTGIEHEVHAAFMRMPHAVQLALWAHHEQADEWLRASNSADLPKGGIDDFSIDHAVEFLDEIVHRIWNKVCAEAEEMAYQRDEVQVNEEEPVDDDA